MSYLPLLKRKSDERIEQLESRVKELEKRCKFLERGLMEAAENASEIAERYIDDGLSKADD